MRHDIRYNSIKSERTIDSTKTWIPHTCRRVTNYEVFSSFCLFACSHHCEWWCLNHFKSFVDGTDGALAGITRPVNYACEWRSGSLTMEVYASCFENLFLKTLKSKQPVRSWMKIEIEILPKRRKSGERVILMECVRRKTLHAMMMNLSHTISRNPPDEWW